MADFGESGEMTLGFSELAFFTGANSSSRRTFKTPNLPFGQYGKKFYKNNSNLKALAYGGSMIVFW